MRLAAVGFVGVRSKGQCFHRQGIVVSGYSEANANGAVFTNYSTGIGIKTLPDSSSVLRLKSS